MTFDPALPLRVARTADRLRLAISGPDRAKFLHNVTTNEIKRRVVGSGCETFITNLQGRTLGYGTILVGPDEILFRTCLRGLDLVLPHFAKYGVFDEVGWDDRTAETLEIHCAAANLDALLGSIIVPLPPATEFAHVATTLGPDGPAVLVIRESPLGLPGITIVGKAADDHMIRERLDALAEWHSLSAQAADALRIEGGIPEYGRDVTPENLPQELGRDNQAISFVKGCYLGQETVARLDALGHVNKILRGLIASNSELIPASATLHAADGKSAGIVTSSAVSPTLGHAVALAMIRVTHAEPGTTLEWQGDDRRGWVTVENLPMFGVATRTGPG